MVRLFATALVASLGAAAGSAPVPAQRVQGVTDCIRFWPEARYGALGYNHIVHVQNGCDANAECRVSTDVNPQPVSVQVPGRKQVEVNTFLGSPAREFTPRVECKMAR